MSSRSYNYSFIMKQSVLCSECCLRCFHCSIGTTQNEHRDINFCNFISEIGGTHFHKCIAKCFAITCCTPLSNQSCMCGIAYYRQHSFKLVILELFFSQVFKMVSL